MTSDDTRTPPPPDEGGEAPCFAHLFDDEHGAGTCDDPQCACHGEM